MAESRVEDLLETGVEQPVLPMSEIEAILRGEPVTPHSRIAELLLKYNPSDILIEKRITENGTYFATNDNADGYYKVVVDEYVPTLILKEVTANGTYDPAVDGADGYSSIRVNLPLEHQIGEVFNQNGLYHVTPSQGYEGISRADIMVQVNPVLETKTIDANGTYTPSQGYDGFSEVTVDVPGQNADLALRCVGLDGYSVTITSADNSETYTKSVTGSPATITFDNLAYVGNWTVSNTKDSTTVTVSNAVSNEDYKLYTQQIPRMTAYDQPSGVISASSEYDDRFLAWFAAANNGGSGENGWMGASMNSYLIYQFAAPVIFSKLYFRIADVWGFNYYNILEYGNDIDVLGSVDGTTYERCTSTGSTVNKKGYGDVNIDLNGKKYKYLKVIVPKATFSRDYYNCGVMNLMLYSDPEATAYMLGPKSITANGTYNPASDGLDGFSEVTVDVPGQNADIHIRCLGVGGGTVTITAMDGSTTYTHTASVTLTDETVIFDELEYAGIWAVSNSKDATTATVDNTYTEGNITLMATKIPQMTSASTPYGECISSSNNRGESRYVWYPFDGANGPIDNITSEAWSNQRGDGSPWIGYHFMDSQGNPIKVKMDKVWVQGFNVVWGNSTTRTLYFEGGNDGTNWEKIGLDKVFDFGINVRQSFEHELNGGKYEYFRIRFDASLNVVDSRWIFIERIQVYANDFAPLPTGALTATENGTYDPEDYDLSAFDEVTVNVPNSLKGALERTVSVIDDSAPESIGPYAFFNYKKADGSSENLTSVKFENATSIGQLAFNGCKFLASADFPKVTSISSNVFSNCTSLTDINFPNTIDISDGVFSGCISLTNADFPKVTSIGQGAFYNCTSLTDINFPKVTSIGDNAFYGCTSLTDVDFPDATSIRSNAFYNCTSLTDINFPKVTGIWQGAFYGCTSLTDVDFPDVEGIGQQAFYNCTSLTEIDFSVLLRIGLSAFQNCSSLGILILRTSDAITNLANINAFNNTPFASGGTGGTLYVPQALISSYQSASNWSTILGYTNNQIKPIEGSIYE